MAGLSTSLILAVSVQLGCQLFKVIVASSRSGAFAWRRFFSAGGMPSAHSAFVAALVTAVALRAGADSELFAVAFVFGIIVVYDTIRVRGAIQLNSEALRTVIAPMPESSRPATAQDIGHTLMEVAVGLLIGIGVAVGARAALLV